MTKRKQMKLVNTIAEKIHREIYNEIITKEQASELIAEFTIIIYDELKKAGVFDE